MADKWKLIATYETAHAARQHAKGIRKPYRKIKKMGKRWGVFMKVPS